MVCPASNGAGVTGPAPTAAWLGGVPPFRAVHAAAIAHAAMIRPRFTQPVRRMVEGRMDERPHGTFRASAELVAALARDQVEIERLVGIHVQSTVDVLALHHLVHDPGFVPGIE